MLKGILSNNFHNTARRHAELLLYASRAYILQCDVQNNSSEWGRISIPEAERQALNIEEGDLVQVIVVPIERKQKSSQHR